MPLDASSTTIAVMLPTTAQLSPSTWPCLATPFALARRSTSVDRLGRRVVIVSTLVLLTGAAACLLRPSAGAEYETPTGTTAEVVVTTPPEVLGIGRTHAALSAPTGTAFRP